MNADPLQLADTAGDDPECGAWFRPLLEVPGMPQRCKREHGHIGWHATPYHQPRWPIAIAVLLVVLAAVLVAWSR